MSKSDFVARSHDLQTAIMELYEYFPGSVAAFIFLLISVFLLIYRHYTRKFDYWKIRGVPYMKPLPFFGTNLDLFVMKMHEAILKRYKENGPLYGTFDGQNPAITVAVPELIRDILVKDFPSFLGHRSITTNDDIMDRMIIFLVGDDWKRVRSLLSPVFSTGKLKRVFSILNDCSSTLVQNFKIASEKGRYINTKSLYGAFAMDIIANSAFSMKIDSHNDPNNDFVRRARHVFSPKLRFRFIMMFLFPRLMKLLGNTMFPKDDIDFFKKVVLQVIEHRKRSGEVRNDFLQLLMDATNETQVDGKSNASNKECDELLSNYGGENINHHIFKNFSNKRLTMNELVAQCVNLFIAGYDTTSSTLSFSTYLLAINQDVQDKLREEVDNALRDGNGKFTYELVQNMKYLDNVISETLRLFPPATGSERVAATPYKLGDTGLTLPEGMLVQIPVYAIHRDPRYFPDPEKFDPNRFTQEERMKRSPYVYLPFGAGPRNCVGMRFALMEIKVCLAHVVANFVIKRCPETKVPVEFHKGVGVLQPKEIILEMELRKK